MFEWLKKILFEEEVVNVEEDKLEKIDFTQVDNIDNIVKEEKIEKKAVIEKEEEKPTIKKEFNIQINNVKKEEKTVEYKPKRERVQETKDIEIGTVISPMFGGKDIKQPQTTSKTVYSPKKKDSLGTVISPMFGQAELLNHEKEAQNKIDETQEITPVLESEEWKNDIPLDELISDDKENTDCFQFSLFGDDQSVNE
ncbi:MAG: hypothetical protein ACI4U3_02615 [Traorella sp.]